MSLAPSGLGLSAFGGSSFVGSGLPGGGFFAPTNSAGKPPQGFRPIINPVTGAPAQLVQNTGLSFDPFQRFLTDPASVSFDLDQRKFIFPALGERESLGLFAGEGGPTVFSLPDTFAFSNPQALGAHLSTFQTPEALSAELAALDAASVAEAKTLAGQAEGIGTLEGAISQVLARETAFQNDPNRLALTQALAARSGPDARVFSQAQEATLLNTIAQTASTAASRRLFSSGGQGGPGTASSAAQATADAISASQGVAAVANIDAVNQAARDRALGDAAAFQVAEDRMTFAFTQELTRLDTMIASIEAGNEFVPFDPTAFTVLDEAIRRHDELMARIDEKEAKVVEAQEFGPLDAVAAFLALQGTGIPGFVGGFLS